MANKVFLGDKDALEADSLESDDLPAADAAATRFPAMRKLSIQKKRMEEIARGPRPPAKLERLQKILSQAGIASRRRARN